MNAAQSLVPGEPEADSAVLAAALAAELVSRSAVISTAESLTGGALSGLLSAAPGASDTYRGGVVAYSAALKVSLLGVSRDAVATHGVVSAECAAQMATGVCSLTGSDYAVSTTGVAGPTEQEGKPVGTVFVAVAGPEGVTTTALRLEGSRAEIRDQTCRAAISAAVAAVAGSDG